MSFLAPTDFIGIYNISVNEFTTAELQLYLDKYEVVYLTDLLGKELYDEFIADLDTAPSITTASVPTDAKFTQIFNSFGIDEDPAMHVSDGMKEMLKLMIYFDWARDNNFVLAITGATTNKFSNAEIVSMNRTRAIENWNLGINTYKEIQWYIEDNPVPYNYDLKNLQIKDYISWL